MSIAEPLTRRLPLDQLSSWSLMAAAAGLLAEIPLLPPVIRAFLLLGFVLVGPGSVVLDWFGELPKVAVRALIPIVGLSVVILVVSLPLFLGFWSSRVTLAALAVVTAALAGHNRMRVTTVGATG
jgi:signal transduction histidine kinase